MASSALAGLTRSFTRRPTPHLSSVGIGVLTLFYVGFISAFVGAAAVIPADRKEVASGQLTPRAGLIAVRARRDAIVSGVLVKNGSIVKRGQPLLTLTMDSDVPDGSKASKLLEAAVRSKAEAIENQISANAVEASTSSADISARLANINSQLLTLMILKRNRERKLTRDQEKVAEYQAIFERGFISKNQMSMWQDKITEDVEQLMDIERQIGQQNSDRARLAIESKQLFGKNSQAQALVSASLAELLASNATATSQGDIVLTAQSAGEVTALLAQRGMPVSSGDTLAAIVPAGSELIAEVWVPTTAIGFIRVGQRVKLKYAAYPFENFGMADGSVFEVANAPTEAKYMSNHPAQAPGYRVLIRLSAQKFRSREKYLRLTPGMAVDAVFILEDRTLFRWAVDPLLSSLGM